MDRQEELRQWLEKADHDLMAAEYLTTMHYPRPDEIICFHCQQAAEKYLKGFFSKTISRRQKYMTL
jgi:HEPN domain-containing protein